MLEPRLYPLLETLTRADLDWLAQEIISGALAGRVTEEIPETIQAERNIVFRRSQDSGVNLLARPSVERYVAFSADEQITWAAQHVAQRLEQVLEMLRHSIDRLSEIAKGEVPGKAPQQTGASIALALALADGEIVSNTEREQLTAAVEGLGRLRDALGTWADEALLGEQA